MPNRVTIEIDAKQLSSVQATFRSLKQQFESIEGAANKTKTSLDKLRTSGDRLKSIGKNLTTHVTLPIIAAGAALTKIAVDVDDAFDTIRAGTGATGAALESLKNSFKTVAQAVPNSIAESAQAIADLNTRTGATGTTLENLAQKSLHLARLQKSDVATTVAAITRLFGDWRITTEQQSIALDYLFKISQSTGISINKLSQQLVYYGVPLRQIGLDFEHAAAMLGKWEKEGVNANLILASLRIGLIRMAEAGLEPQRALSGFIEKIKNTRSEAEAAAISAKVFGARAGPDMAGAIREGRFEIEELVSALQSSSETIDKAVLDTDGFKEAWGRLKNEVTLALEPLGTELVQVLEDAVPAMRKMIEHLRDATEWWQSLPPSTKRAASEIVAFAAIAGPAILGVGAAMNVLSASIKNVGAMLTWLRAHPAIALLTGLVIAEKSGTIDAFAARASNWLIPGLESGVTDADRAAERQTRLEGEQSRERLNAALVRNPQARARIESLRQQEASMRRGLQTPATRAEADRLAEQRFALERQLLSSSTHPTNPRPTSPKPPTPTGLSKLLSGSKGKGKSKSKSTDLAPLFAGLELAEMTLSESGESIRNAISAGNLDAATAALAKYRAEMTRLVDERVKLEIRQDTASKQRALSANETTLIRRKALAGAMRELTSLTQELDRAQQSAAENAERDEQQRIQRLSRLKTDIRELQASLLSDIMSNATPGQALQMMPAYRQLTLQPLAANLQNALLLGDPLQIQRAALELDRARLNLIEREKRLQAEITREQEDARQLQQERLQMEREAADIKRETALIYARAEADNAAETLEILRQQGANREQLKAAEIQMLNTQKQRLQAERDSLNIQLDELKIRLAYISAAASLTPADQRQSALLEIAKMQQTIAEIEVALSRIGIQIQRTDYELARKNPFSQWQESLEQIQKSFEDAFADALAGASSLRDAFKSAWMDIKRTFWRIIVQETLSPLLNVVRAWAAQAGQAIFGGIIGAGNRAGSATTNLSQQPGAPGLPPGIKLPAGWGGRLNNAVGAYAIGYTGARALGLKNPSGAGTGAAIGSLIGSFIPGVGNVIGGIAGGLIGSLFGGGRRSSSVEMIPLTSSGHTVINNSIRLTLDSREISRALVSNRF